MVVWFCFSRPHSESGLQGLCSPRREPARSEASCPAGDVGSAGSAALLPSESSGPHRAAGGFSFPGDRNLWTRLWYESVAYKAAGLSLLPRTAPRPPPSPPAGPLSGEASVGHLGHPLHVGAGVASVSLAAPEVLLPREWLLSALHPGWGLEPPDSSASAFESSSPSILQRVPLVKRT